MWATVLATCFNVAGRTRIYRFKYQLPRSQYIDFAQDIALHQHPRKMGLHPTALCECGLSEQTPEHILQMCPNMSSRQHFWPEPTALKTKLWGTVEDRRKTTNFVEYHGLRV
jgi:hypothetical protein